MTLRLSSLLTPFYKAVHPDVLGTAPDKIRQTNNKAVATLNSYVDAYKHSQPLPLTVLEFYVKGGPIKFHRCKLTLLPLNPRATQAQRDTHIENTVRNILRAVKSPEEPSLPHAADDLVLKRNPSAEADRLIHSFLWQQACENHQQTRMNKYKRYGLRRAMMYNIEDSYSLSAPAQFRRYAPNLFVKEAVEHAVKPAMMEKLQMLGLELNQLFFDESLSMEQCNAAIRRLAGTEEPIRNMLKNIEVFRSIGTNGLGLMVEQDYSAARLPGFICIPWDFEWSTFVTFYTEHKAYSMHAMSQYAKQKRAN